MQNPTTVVFRMHFKTISSLQAHIFHKATCTYTYAKCKCIEDKKFKIQCELYPPFLLY